MTVKEIVEFLTDRPGYLHEGARRLAIKVLKGKASIDDCRTALKLVNGVEKILDEEYDYIEDLPNVGKKIIDQIPPHLKLKSRWQSASGEWLESYKTTDEVSGLSKQDIEESITNTLKDVNPTILQKQITTSNKSLLVWTSDKHIGASTDEAMFENDYDEFEFQKRLSVLLKKIFGKVNEYGRLETLVIADLGDAIDGQDGFTASKMHKLPQNMTNRQMFDTYLNTHIKFVDSLIANNFANNYEFWFITKSNHGGVLEYAACKALQTYISVKYPKLVVVKSLDKFINHVEFRDVTYLLSHGKDDGNRKFGLPLYPDPKTEIIIDNYLKMNKLSLNERVRLIKGDLHLPTSTPCKNIERYRTVGSMFGSSGWIMDNFGFTRACTCYEIYDEHNGDILEGTWYYN